MISTFFPSSFSEAPPTLKASAPYRLVYDLKESYDLLMKFSAEVSLQLPDHAIPL